MTVLTTPQVVSMDSMCFGREVTGHLSIALEREWLVTNGLGGFASGTVAQVNTRRYHGLLVAALSPPVQRTLLLASLDVNVKLRNRTVELATHEYAGGTIHPQGYRLQQSFQLDGTIPTWTYAIDDALLVQRIHMPRGQNTTLVTFTLERSNEPVQLTLRPLCSSRDYHWQRSGPHGLWHEEIDGGVRVLAEYSPAQLHLSVNGSEFRSAADWHWNLLHRAELLRGLDAVEDHYVPGFFTVTLAPGESATFTANTGAASLKSWDQELREHRQREQRLIATVAGAEPRWIQQLVLAADQFVVARRDSVAAAAADGTTIIAGYPWFSDWGRDTMIALPGLTLATGRPEIAADVLRTFARHVDRGMLPNRFPDAGESPEYNTVDATLWYFVAVHEYLQATGDCALVTELLPTLDDIVEWHLRGTRHGIQVDPTDGLLRAGEPGVQLTWMDAKVGDWVVTPRTGKPVEINALWCNALFILEALCTATLKVEAGKRWSALARRAADSFQERYWYDQGDHLYDVIDIPGSAHPDASLRPNQLIALALPFELLDRQQQIAALQTCERQLLTSVGLRTLAPDATAYQGRYAGSPRDRDGAYHQGTVWPWLIGAFVRAHLRLHGDPARARSYLEPLALHLQDACIGQISEIFDGDPPHQPQGCFAQAWSVAEVLTAWSAIRRAETATRKNSESTATRRASKPRSRKSLRKVS